MQQNNIRKYTYIYDNITKTNNMPDISCCEGGSCPLRLNCHRYTVKPEEIGQTYFSTPPYKMNMMLDDHDNGFGVVTIACSYFWNNKDFKDEKSGNK